MIDLKLMEARVLEWREDRHEGEREVQEVFWPIVKGRRTSVRKALKKCSWGDGPVERS